MTLTPAFSRRRFLGGVTATLGAVTLRPSLDLWPQTPGATRQDRTADEYDALAKLANNENPYGPSEAVLEAMTRAFKYANRYGYPDGGIVQAIAQHHGVERENVMLGAGSGEILEVCCSALLQSGRKVVGAEPSYNILYQNAASLKADQIKLPLLPDHRQDIPALIRATHRNRRDVGFVYLCNPNNPTGTMRPADAVEEFLGSVPESVLVVVDEAYHEFVGDPTYQTVSGYAVERPNVVALRTFSKIYSLAGLRIGYAIGHPETLSGLRKAQQPLTVNRIAQTAALASLGQPEELSRRAADNVSARHYLAGAIEERGLEQVESHTNFVYFRTPSGDSKSLAGELTIRGVLVRPMSAEWLRVTVGSPEENRRFVEVLDQVLAVNR